MPMGDGSSILDYMPLTGPYRAFAGDGGEQGGCPDGQQECGSTTFIDQATGQEIEGAYWACGACGHVPIRSGDGSCPACSETVDWDPNNPEHQEQ